MLTREDKEWIIQIMTASTRFLGTVTMELSPLIDRTAAERKTTLASELEKFTRELLELKNA